MRTVTVLSIMMAGFVLNAASAMPINHNYPSARNRQSSGVSPAAKQACKADVRKLCGSQVPNHMRIVSCLRSHIAQLSAECRRSLAAR